MSDFQSMAARLYGTPEAAPAADPSPAPATARTAPAPAARTVQATSQPAAPVDPLESLRAPQDILDQRTADKASRMYADSDGWNDGIHDLAQQLAVQAKLSPEQASEAAGELVAAYRDMGLTAAEARALSEGAVKASTPVEKAALHDSIVQAINQAHRENASAMVRLAVRFIAADPRRAALVDALGDSPAAALLLIQKARDAAARGRK